MREAKSLYIIDLLHREDMSVKQYALKFIQFSNHAPCIVADIKKGKEGWWSFFKKERPVKVIILKVMVIVKKCGVRVGNVGETQVLVPSQLNASFGL